MAPSWVLQLVCVAIILPSATAQAVLTAKVGRFFRFDLGQALQITTDTTANPRFSLGEAGFPNVPRFLNLVQSPLLLYGTGPREAGSYQLTLTWAQARAETQVLNFTLTVEDASELLYQCRIAMSCA